MSAARAAAVEAARIAQVGYTAVIDRMTPDLTHEIVAANVARSVASAGGTPAASPMLEKAWSPAYRLGAVSFYEPSRREGGFGTEGVLAFGITVETNGEHGAIAATAVLHEPSARLRADAGTLSSALLAVLGSIRPGSAPDALAADFARHTAAVSGEAELIVLRLVGGRTASVLSGTVLAEGDVLAVGAVARTAGGPIVLQTTVHVDAEGAERLDAIPLRLIELR